MATRGQLKFRREQDRLNLQRTLQEAAAAMPPTNVLGPEGFQMPAEARNVPNPTMQDIGWAAKSFPLTQATGSVMEQWGLGNKATPGQLGLAAVETGLNLFDAATLGATAPARAAAGHVMRQMPKGQTIPITHFGRAQHPYLSAAEAGTNPMISGAERLRADRIPAVHGYATGSDFTREAGLGREVMHAKATKILDTSSKAAKNIRAKVRDKLKKKYASERYAGHIDPMEMASEFEREAQRKGYRGLKSGDVVTSWADLDVARRGTVAPGMANRPTTGQLADYAASNPEGFSINPRTGEVPSSGIARSLPGSEVQFKGMPKEEIRKYLEAGNVKPGEYLGGWQSEGTTYLDRSKIGTNRIAEELKGEAGYQKALYDIGKGEEIPLTVRPFVEDLPRLMQGRDRGYFGVREAARMVTPKFKAEAMGGPGSAKADLEMLDLARELDYEGKLSREKIYDATGWAKDDDGRWVFEITDDKALWKQNQPAEGSLVEKMFNQQVYEHYPQLKGLDVVEKPMPKGGRGYFSGEKEQIGMNQDMPNYQKTSTGVHETEHAIQHLENRDLGTGDPNMIYQNSVGLSRIVAKQMQQLEATMNALENPPKGSWMEGLNPEDREAVLDEFNERWMRYAKAREQLGDQGGTPQNAFNFYRNSLGETNARNAQRRQHLTGEERRMYPWYKSRELETPSKDIVIGGPQAVIPEDLSTLMEEAAKRGHPDFEFNPGSSADTDFEAFKKQFELLPAKKATPTVVRPERQFAPGIYKDPRQIMEEAIPRVAPENPMMKEIFGVDRRAMDEATRETVARGVRDEVNPPVPNVTGRAAPYAERIMNPRNVQRLQDTLQLARGTPELAGSEGWYYTHPLFRRYTELLGPEEGLRRFREDMAVGSALSPGSPVDLELRRTSLYNLDPQRFLQSKVTSGENTARTYPDLFAGVGDAKPYGHIYHSTAHAPGLERIAAGEKFYTGDAPKTPNYYYSKTGQNLRYPTPDAHFVRGIGLADVRPPTKSSSGRSASAIEHAKIRDWFADKVADPVGMAGSPAQALMWNALGPQTGVKTKIGKPYLELLIDAAMKQVAREGKRVNKGTVQDAVDKFILRKGLLG